LWSVVIAAWNAGKKSVRMAMVIGIEGCAVTAGRSLGICAKPRDTVLLSQPSVGTGPATPRIPASVCANMSV
jgi:hypothetical protein